PDTLGGLRINRLNRNNVFDYDARIIQLAHERGIPPQFFKGQIEQETGGATFFNPKTWRYEPITKDYGAPWGPECHSVSLDNLNASTAEREFLGMAFKSPWSDYAVGNSLALLTPADLAPRASLKICKAGTLQSIGPSDTPTARDIYNANPRQHFGH